jgi:hypothetical protein
MEMDRRAALVLLGGGAAAAGLEAAQPQPLQFFSPAEYELIDAATELIIPADAHSPGAREAKVAAYIDLVVSHSPAEVKTNWKSRLTAFRDLAQQLGTRAALEQAASNERSPSTAAEHFFVDLKRLTVSGYYTTEIGLLKELGYKGNEVLGRFQGCQHQPGTHQ